MRKSKSRFAKIETTEVEIIPMNCTVPMELKNFGGSFYARLPPEIIGYYHLGKLSLSDIMLKVTIIEAQRVKSSHPTSP